MSTAIKLHNMKVAYESPYQPVGSWRRADPYTIAFVYTQTGKQFVAKGGYQDVFKYVQAGASKVPLIVHFVFYARGERITSIKVMGLAKGAPYAYVSRDKRNKRRPYSLTVGKYRKHLRRPPQCWMQELDKYCPKEA